MHRTVQMFLQDKIFPLSDNLCLGQLPHLSDIFSLLNELKLGIQGLSINVFDVQNKITEMLIKMELFEIKVKMEDVSAFPALKRFMSDNDLNLADRVRDNIVAYLVSLRQWLQEYFPVMPESNNWIRNPFVSIISDITKDFTVGEQESLIKLS